MTPQEFNYLENFKDVISKVISLAQDRIWARRANNHNSGNGTVCSVASYSEIVPKEIEEDKALREYLWNLDYEAIKVLQTIMYIGRDDFFKKDGTYSYSEARAYFDKDGWQDDKTIEANQICEKSPLASYLLEGCKKIGFEL